MKRILSAAVVLCMMLAFAVPANADSPRRNSVFELYSAEGFYDGGGEFSESWSYHVPQIFDDTADADSINRDIGERFGTRVEEQFQSMENGSHPWMTSVHWESYWNGTKLFLLISSEEEGNFTDYAAYGYDFESGSRVSNRMVLEQKGVTEEEYMLNLREKVQLIFEDMYGGLSVRDREIVGYDEMLEKTMNWLNPELPLYLDAFGEIVTIVKIASVAGAEWHYHLVTPFAYG